MILILTFLYPEKSFVLDDRYDGKESKREKDIEKRKLSLYEINDFLKIMR